MGVDRIWAIWEACHGCSNVTEAQRVTHSQCYVNDPRSEVPDGITDEMPFYYYQNQSDGTFKLVKASEAKDLEEYWDKKIKTPGDVLSISTLGYKYDRDELDNELVRLNVCPNDKAFEDTFMLLEANHAKNSDSNFNGYRKWLTDTNKKVQAALSKLKDLDVLGASWFNGISIAAKDYASETLAVCDCLHTNNALQERGVDGQADISSMSRRKWNRENLHNPCLVAITSEDAYVKGQRLICEVAMSDSFETKLDLLTAWMTQNTNAAIAKMKELAGSEDLNAKAQEWVQSIAGVMKDKTKGNTN